MESAMSVSWRWCVGSLRRRGRGGGVQRRGCATTNTNSIEVNDERGKSDKHARWPRRVVSGLQPTGVLHVGNYFGALRRLVRAQDSGDHVVMFIADLHALTASPASASSVGGGTLSEHTLSLATMALAAGIDPARTVLFTQSHVPRHAELCWLLACLTTPERLKHLPQYCERGAAAGGGGAAGLGVLLYPVLQAADILLYRGTHVPTGIDQVPHLQLAAQLARAFNRRHGPCFPEPAAWIADDGSDRVLSLRRPDNKMSKSDPDAKSRILVTDGDDVIKRKLRKAVTDFTPRVTFEPRERPGVSNLVRLHCLAADKLPEEVVEECDQLTTAQYKMVVAEALCTALRDIRSRAAALEHKPRVVRDALRAGAARARAIADQVYADAARLAGLIQPAIPLPLPLQKETNESKKVQQKVNEVEMRETVK